MQSDFHDPVRVFKIIMDFGWTMAKLILLLGKALVSKLIKDVTKNKNEKHEYQGVQLQHSK